MKTERKSIYRGPVVLTSIADRVVKIPVKIDESKKIHAELYKDDPNQEHSCRFYEGKVIFEVPRRMKNGRTPATTFMVDFYQYVEVSKPAPIAEAEPEITGNESFGLSSLNPEKDGSEVKGKGSLLSVVKNRLSQKAIAKADIRRGELQKKRSDHAEAKALKPVGLDNKNVLTCDDVGYTKAAGIIKYIMMMENELNKNVEEADRRLINEFYDCFAFSGPPTIIALYLSLGKKSVGNGSIEYLLNWWIHKFRYAFSATPGQNAKAKIARLFKGKEPEGFSEKKVRKILEGLFINPNTKEQYTLSDINKEVYQPMMLMDLRARAYTKWESPNTSLVDVAMNCAIDPQLFHTKQTEEEGLSIGPFRRSFDLPFAQYNDNITIMSLGVPLRYQAPKENKANSAQIASIKQEASYLTDYHTTMKYMSDNQHKLKYVRVETMPMDVFSNYSVNHDNLRYAVACGEKSSIISNGQKLLS